MIIELILFGVFTLLLYLHWTQTRSKFAKMINVFPGPATRLFSGNLLNFSRKHDIIFKQLREYNKQYLETWRVWSAHLGALSILTPEDVEVVLSSSKHIRKSIIYEFLEPWLGTGLLTSTGAKWQHRRKLLTPAFHFNILRKFVNIFGDHSLKLVEKLNNECLKTKTNIVPIITNITLETICETAMGTNLDPKDKIQKRYYTGIYELAPLIVQRTMSPWVYNNFLFNLMPIGWKQNKILKNLHNFTDSVIKEREANFKDSDLKNLNKKEEEDGTKKKKLAMLDLLLSAKKQKKNIDDKGIREEVDTFMFEGHDTTSMALCFALMLLANHNDVQEKIISELDEIFGDSKRPANYEDLQKMRYLDLCLKECLRLYPSVPFISRKINEDVTLSKAIAPAGTILLIHIYDLHRNPKNFPNPEKFDPERFLPENSKGRHPYAYIPFSAGPRNCIGQKFAILEMKSFVSAILRNYIMEPIDKPEDLTLKLDIVLRTTGEINIKFKPRFS